MLPWWALDLGGHTVRLLIVVIFHLYFSISSMTEDQSVKLVSLTDQTVASHTFNPSSQTSLS